MHDAKSALVYSSRLESYSFGEGHPLGTDRFRIFFDFFKSRFAKVMDDFAIVEPEPATDFELELAHTKEYINAIRLASSGEMLHDVYRYVSADNLNPVTGYIPQGIDEGSKIVVGISLKTGELVAEGKFKKAFGVGGGMHHAKPDYGEGFCFYNDVAICVKHLKRKYNLNRILVLDTDAHAGNGTSQIFYADPQVLFIDIHQDPRTLYPGTGFIEDIGRGEGEGFNVNVPLAPRTGNDAYEYVFQEVIFPLAEEFKPQLIIRYGGSDPHYLDTLTSLGLTVEGFRMIGRKTHELCRQFTEGKCIDLMLSGYNVRVLPFAWAALMAGAAGLEIDLSGFKEADAPPKDSGLEETKEIVSRLKKHLSKYWKALAS